MYLKDGQRLARGGTCDGGILFAGSSNENVMPNPILLCDYVQWIVQCLWYYSIDALCKLMYVVLPPRPTPAARVV